MTSIANGLGDDMSKLKDSLFILAGTELNDVQRDEVIECIRALNNLMSSADDLSAFAKDLHT